MKQKCFYKIILIVMGLSFHSNFLVSQPINYTFSNLAGVYSPLVGPTAIPEIYWGADNELSGIYNIGFSFNFGCASYTQFKVSADGWLTFNLGGAVSFADAINDLSGYAGMRPGLAPLWDDLAWNNNNPPQCGYQLSGILPNRILTVQWIKANWKILGTAPGEMSFQIKLYETSDRIEFIYHQETGTMNAPSASIGLAGSVIGDYYSVNAALTTASKAINTQNIATKPAEGKTFRWDPVCALPIELISFTGEKLGNKNLFKWSTATENNNCFFTLEYSGDGISFNEIKKIKGAGNSNSTKHYETMDEPFNSGITYYRLKQTDFNNSYKYSNVLAIDNNLKENNFNLYPNPSDREFSIQLNEVSSVTVYSYEGKLIEQFNAMNENFSFGKDYSAGIYFVKISGTETSSAFKIIKQ